jgi:hypothetical protein
MVFADTPKSIAGPHGHALEVQGKITMFRVQQQGLELGDKSNFIDAEVLVTLDSEPGKVFGIRLHGDSEANREITNTLRTAYLNGKPVTIQHKMSPGKSNLQIVWVQLGKLPAWAAMD